MNLHGIDFYEGMHPLTLRCMEETLSMLSADSLVNPIDTIAWNLVAHNLDIFLESKEHLKSTRDEPGLVDITDRGNLAVSPYFTINAKVQSLLQGLMKDLGLTPAARAKMRKEEGKEEESLLEQLLRGNGKN